MRFRFSIRDLLWLTLVVAMVVGWWLDRAQLRRQLDAAMSHAYDTEELHAQNEALKGQLEILRAGGKK